MTRNIQLETIKTASGYIPRSENYMDFVVPNGYNTAEYYYYVTYEETGVRVAIDVVALRQTVVIHATECVALGGHVEGVVGCRRTDDEVFDVLFALGHGAGEREHKHQRKQQGDKFLHSDYSSFYLVRKTTKSTASTIFFGRHSALSAPNKPAAVRRNGIFGYRKNSSSETGKTIDCRKKYVF